MENLTELFELTVEGLGYELWGIERGREFGAQLIRVYIDKEMGVTVADCERVSRHLGDVVEAERAVSGNYVLEISSPGIDRRFFSLEQHKGYVGRTITLKLRELLNGRRTYKGVLEGVSDGRLVINWEGSLLEIEYSNLERSSLVDAN